MEMPKITSVYQSPTWGG